MPYPTTPVRDGFPWYKEVATKGGVRRAMRRATSIGPRTARESAMWPWDIQQILLSHDYVYGELSSGDAPRVDWYQMCWFFEVGGIAASSWYPGRPGPGR